MKFLSLLLTFTLIVRVYSFASSEDKFFKKFAMMKIYESCFGEEVVRQIRREMKQACAKCANGDPSVFNQHSPQEPPASSQEQHPQEDEKASPTSGSGSSFQTIPQPPFDVEKLHQAILAFRPNVASQQSFRPFPGIGPVPPNFYNPYGNSPFSMGPPLYYPGYQVPFSPYNLPMVGQQYFGNRISREMDIRGQLEMLTNKISGRAKNVTCILQELGYLDENFEPNFARMSERISNLPISEELKKDMLEGVTFCQQFSQCVPEVKKEKSPLSRDFVRPMLFFKCYKQKKLESCIMKDIHEKFSSMTEDEFEGDLDLRRMGKAKQLPETRQDNENDEMAEAMYDLLYASESSFDIDDL